MKHIFPLLIVVLLLVPLAAAVEITLPKTDFTRGETVTIAISSCTGDSLLRIFNPEPQLVQLDQGRNNWGSSYNSLSDPSSGRYTLRANCENGEIERQFCVDSPGCVPAAQEDTLGIQPDISPGCTDPAALNYNESALTDDRSCSYPSPLPTGRYTCSREWSCGVWSFCNASLQQSLDCVDVKACDTRQLTRSFVRECPKCQESWVCTNWNQCSNGQQRRSCADEHACRTSEYKPLLQKSCQAAEPKPLPARIVQELPPSYTPPYTPPQVRQPAQAPFISRAWNDYKAYIVGVPLGALLLALVTILIVHYARGKKVSYNLQELEEWIRQERDAGTSDEDIKNILTEQTGWAPEEVDKALGEM